MNRREELQYLLEGVIGNDHVYFQPPENLKIKYPAIVYSINKIVNDHANDSVYLQNRSYTINVIDYDPDSDIVDRMSMLPMCEFDRHYVAGNLHHSTFVLYY